MLALVSVAVALAAADPLPSWNDTGPKRAITAWVQSATTRGSEGFVEAPERVAVFDNDGTLWSEQPMAVELAFTLDRVKALGPAHPEWKTRSPFKAALQRDLAALARSGKKGLLELVAATHAGQSPEEFQRLAREWFATARDEKGRSYAERVYPPMLELLAYLRANGFKTYIVSGGGIEFMRAVAPDLYGVPPEQIIGSSAKTELVMRAGRPQLNRLPKVDFIDDGPAKPVAINQHIGRRPVLAFGNSDGDLAMLQWTAAGDGRPLLGLVHHTDGERETAYDRTAAMGKLDVALDEARRQGWVVVDVKEDWKTVFPKVETVMP